MVAECENMHIRSGLQENTHWWKLQHTEKIMIK